MANFNLKTYSIAFMAGVAVLLQSTYALSASSTHRADVAGSVYQDDLYTVTNSSAAYSLNTSKIFAKQGRETGLGLNITNKSISLNETDARSLELLGGNESINVLGASLSLDQGIAVGTSVGVFGGIQDSPVNGSQYFGGRVSQWWLHDTIQTSLEIRKNNMEQESLDFTDVDGKRIITPDQIEGTNIGLQVTHMATTSTIMKYGYSLTQRTDRPSAWSGFAEGRQYITPAKGAVHLNYSYYSNVGKIQPITDYGTVEAHSAALTWKQKLGKRTLWSAGYRFHYETEDPRAVESDFKHVGSDYYFTSAAYRLARQPWSQSTSEISALAGYYMSNEPAKGYIFGLGLTYFL